MRLGFVSSGTATDLQFAEAAGFDCIELAIDGDTPLFQDHRDFARAVCDHPTEVSAITLLRQNYFADRMADRQVAEEQLGRTIDLAAALGAPLIITGSGTPPMSTNSSQVQVILDRMDPWIADVQALGIGFVFHNSSVQNVINRPSQWDELCLARPDMGIAFNPVHPIRGERDWQAELNAAGARLRHVHASDLLHAGTSAIAQPIPGLGSLPWSAVFGHLYQIGFTGSISIDPQGDLYTGEWRYPFLDLSQRHLRRFLLDPAVGQLSL